MIQKYLIVNKKILPEVFDKVIEARNLINNNSVKGISEAVKEVGISRSTYYKYKDYVFAPSEETIGRKAVFSIMLNHEKGSLSNLLNKIADFNANVLTINQSIPINSKASVSLSLDVSGMDISIDDMLSSLKKNKGVAYIKLLAIE